MVTQQKTGAVVSIPLHPDLQSALSTLPRSNMTFLINGYGKPFTPAGFGNWFRDRVQEAGLPDGLSAHGLRKAVCRRLAEAGCTPNQIMAISGHKTLGEVERYTREASRVGLANSAFDVLARVSGGGDDGSDREQNSANSGKEFAKPRLKSLK
ncbi:MAG TPA: tyrosine-type recombinase/integrase [Devosiaceae bacterium]